MTEIKVILDSDTGTDISSLSDEERELLFEQIADNNPTVPRAVIAAFAEMQTSILRQNIRFNKPELKELLLRKVVQLSQNRGTDFNTIVVPIIPSFTVNIHHRKASAVGGAPPMRRARAPETARADTAGAIKIRFDTKTLAVTLTGLDYIIPPNEEIEMIGFVVNPICSELHSLGRNSLKKLTAAVIKPATIKEHLLLGTYDYVLAGQTCEDYFTHINRSLRIASTEFRESFKVMFTEMDEKQIAHTLSSIFDYIVGIELYQQSLPAAQSIYNQVDIAVMKRGAKSVRPALRDAFTVVDDPIPNFYGKPGPRIDLLDVLESIHFGRFSTVYRGAVLLDIDQRGFSRIYQKAMIKGKDDPSVLKSLSVYKERKERIAFQARIKEKLLAERNKIGAYMIIIEKKLGAARSREIEYQISIRPSILSAAKNVLELLKPGERKLIELEYERREKYLEAVINNKCPHVRLYRQFRYSRDDERTKKLLFELKNFFKNPDESNSMITCNNCGFDIMCPHLRDFTELDLAGKFHAEIKAKLTKYIDRAVVKDQYYCKICGEMISSLEAFGDITVRDAATTMNEDLKNFMWGEMAALTKYLKFGNVVNVPQLITAARDACYPYIFEIEKQILKSKTNSADEIKAKKRLYVVIYAFAYFIHLILGNQSRGGETSVSFKNFTQRNSKNVIVDLIKHSLDIIILSRNIVIREIPGMSSDVIKNTLIEAYKSMQIAGTQVVIHSSETEDILTTLLLDPVYKYLYLANTIDALISGKKASFIQGQADEVDKIDEIMGSTVSGLEKSKDIFELARVPKFDKWGVTAFDNLKPFGSGQKPDNIWKDAYIGYFARSFESFYSKISSRLYIEPMYVDTAAGAKADLADPATVKFREVHAKHHEEFAKLESIEKELLKYRELRFAQAYNFIRVDRTRRWADPKVSLGRVYDENGSNHIWGIYITDGEERKEMKAQDIAKGIESGTAFTAKIVDKKCTICGVFWSRADKLSEPKIRDSLHARHVINNFFRFYENRCPRGGLHEFAEGKCKKCGIDNGFFANTSSQGAMKYYHEFEKAYDTERVEFNATKDLAVTIKPPQDLSRYAAEYEKWSFNFNVVLDLANKIKVNHRLISAMGAVEKQEYAEVQSGAFIPSEADARHDTRIYVLNAHIKNLITEYNQLRFFHRLAKPSMDLSTIIDNSGINKHKITELSKKLPDILNDHNNRFAYVQRNKKPREIVAFCIQTFCEMCLVIWGDPDRETERLRHDFVEYFVKKVLRGDELLSKPGHFNWSLLYGDKDAKEKDTYDMNFNKDLEDERDREFEDTEKEEGFGDTSAPMTAPDFDVDDVDKDPGDDDSVNEWRVGEDLGLT